MRPVHREPDDRGTKEHGPDQGHVREVRAAPIRIVQDNRIPVVQRPGEVPQDRLDRERHGAEVDRDVLRLRNHPAFCVEERAARVHPLLDVRGVRRPPKGDAHLLRDERQGGLEDFKLRGVHAPT